MERAPGTHWIRGWVNPRAGLDDVDIENSWPHRDSNSDPYVVHPVASRYIDCAIIIIIIIIISCLWCLQIKMEGLLLYKQVFLLFHS
jgi:hypothetical protein